MKNLPVVIMQTESLVAIFWAFHVNGKASCHCRPSPHSMMQRCLEKLKANSGPTSTDTSTSHRTQSLQETRVDNLAESEEE